MLLARIGGAVRRPVGLRALATRGAAAKGPEEAAGDGAAAEGPSLGRRILLGLARLGGLNSDESVVMRKSAVLYDSIGEDKDAFFSGSTGLIKDYRTWFELSVLHMWLALLNLRWHDTAGRALSQATFNTFWEEAERKQADLGLKVGSVRTKNMKILLDEYLGSMIAYDKGAFGSDAEMAGALWRNLYLLDEERVRGVHLANMVEFVRREAAALTKGKDGDTSVLDTGHVEWGAAPGKQ